jgi:hypothetical protein
MKASIAIIAGEGSLPVEISQRLFSDSRAHVAYSLRSDNSTLEKTASDIIRLESPDFAGVIGHMKSKGIDSVILAGNIPKRLIYESEKIDEVGKQILAGLNSRDDHSLLGIIVSTFESFGIRVLPYRELLPELLASKGILAGREPSAGELDDIEYGKDILEILLPLSFGQAVVVAGKAVVAVEAMEGTDETIRRAGSISSGGVVVKMMKAGQDERFDLPTVGPETLKNMSASGLTCLAVEAGKTLIMDRDRFCDIASRSDISVIGL